MGPLSLPALSPLTHTLSFGLCIIVRWKKISPGSISGPRLWAGRNPQWSQARLRPGVQRERLMRLTPASKSSGPGQVAIPTAQGL